MTGFEKLVKQVEAHYIVRTTKTTNVTYNVFGEVIEHNTETKSELYVWDDKECAWVKGCAEKEKE